MILKTETSLIVLIADDLSVPARKPVRIRALDWSSPRSRGP